MKSWKQSADLFAALGDETRLRVFAKLCADGPQSVTRLTHAADVTRQAVSKHLKVLEDAGLVRSLKAGRESIFELERKRLDETRAYLDAISAEWDETIARLKAFVDD